MEEKSMQFECTWKLENHSALNPIRFPDIESPAFEIPMLPRIKWCLGYSPKFSDDLTVFLKRFDNDDGPTTTAAMYSISILKENGFELGNSGTSTISFQKGYSSISTIKLNDKEQLHVSNVTSLVSTPSKQPTISTVKLEDREQLNAINILTLKCTFFASEDEIANEFQEDMTILSNDIKSLFINEVLCDITLKQHNCEFKAHKAILWARLPELLTLENSEVAFGGPDAFKIQPSELKSLLQDIYSGRLDTFKSDAPLLANVRKYELILQGGKIPTLSSICLYSNVQTFSIFQVCSFNFDQLGCNKKVYSPVFSIKDNEMSLWKLVAQLTNRSGCEKVELCLRCVSTETSNPVYLRYKIKVSGGMKDLCRSSSHLFFSGEDYILPWDLNVADITDNSGISHDYFAQFNSVPISRNFKFECTLSVSNGSVSCISETWYSKPLSADTDYKILSNDLNNLYKNKKFSDISLVVGEVPFPAHKAILAARSPVFSKMFQANMAECLNNQVTITDVEPESMESLLEYIYSGRANIQNNANVIQLYTAADKYEVLNLKQKCALYLKRELNLENFGVILILADMHHDETLKKCVQSFIYEKADEILITDEWKDVTEKRIELAVEIVHHLSVKYADKRKSISHATSNTQFGFKYADKKESISHTAFTPGPCQFGSTSVFGGSYQK